MIVKEEKLVYSKNTEYIEYVIINKDIVNNTKTEIKSNWKKHKFSLGNERSIYYPIDKYCIYLSEPYTIKYLDANQQQIKDDDKKKMDISYITNLFYINLNPGGSQPFRLLDFFLDKEYIGYDELPIQLEPFGNNTQKYNIIFKFQEVSISKIDYRTPNYQQISIFHRFEPFRIFAGMGNPVTIALKLTYTAMSPIYNEKVVDIVVTLLQALTLPYKGSDGYKSPPFIYFKFGNYLPVGRYIVKKAIREVGDYPNDVSITNGKELSRQYCYFDEKKNIVSPSIFLSYAEACMNGLPLRQSITLELESYYDYANFETAYKYEIEDRLYVKPS